MCPANAILKNFETDTVSVAMLHETECLCLTCLVLNCILCPGLKTELNAVQLGNLLDLAPIDLSAAALPAVGVPPLDVPGLLGVQFLGFSVANFSSTTNADLSVSSVQLSGCCGKRPA